MFAASYKIATVWGIPIKLHISLLIMVLLFARYFGWGMAILMEAGLAISIVLHELGHSIVAIKKGCRVSEITLMCIGGAAQMEQIPTRPRDEFLMAAAGPAVSLVLGLLLTFVIGPLVPVPVVPFYDVGLLTVLGVVNLVLVVFNLAPAFPMDGGRILRALLTPRLGRLKATRVASRLGQVIILLWGLYGFIDGNWLLVAVAFFVFIAAGNEYRLVELQERVRHNAGRAATRPATLAETTINDEVSVGPAPYDARGQATGQGPAEDPVGAPRN